MMLDTSTLVTFVLASAAIIVSPGPAQALVFARTLSDGRKAGVLTAVGLNVGTMVHAAAAGLGVSAVLATSALTFNVVKYLGAAYLFYLGVCAIRTRDRTPQSNGRSRDPRVAVARAIVTGTLNPKVALFFLAFLPQFVDPARGSVLAQCLVLGGLLAAMDVVYECALVYASAAATAWLRHPTIIAWRERITGGVLIGLGARLALEERPS
jgi:threonine/homoserine/homoserine lactone efflux protein